MSKWIAWDSKNHFYTDISGIVWKITWISQRNSILTLCISGDLIQMSSQ